MEEKIQTKIDGDRIIIEIMTNRFTHDLVQDLRNTYPPELLANYNPIEFNLRQVKMIDSSSIGFLFELNNKLHTINGATRIILSVSDNQELKDLLHKFQVDLLLHVK